MQVNEIGKEERWVWTVVGIRLEIKKDRDRGKSGREGIVEIKVRLREDGEE